jgi:hypothetical protein
MGMHVPPNVWEHVFEHVQHHWFAVGVAGDKVKLLLPDENVPEWLPGLGRNVVPESHYSARDADGNWQRVDKYADSEARSAVRSRAAELRSDDAVRARAAALGLTTALALTAAMDAPFLQTRWRYACELRNTPVPEEPDDAELSEPVEPPPPPPPPAVWL